jgi:coenzyme F420-reducing hydrogenase delta subunit
MGFDGVLAIRCSDDDCKFPEGRQTAERNEIALEKALDILKLKDRFELLTTSPRMIGDFNSKLDSFISKISALPKTN